MTKTISDHVSMDTSLKAIVQLQCNSNCYFIDFYKDNKLISTEFFPSKSIHYVEDAAENYVLGIKKVA